MGVIVSSKALSENDIGIADLLGHVTYEEDRVGASLPT